jgi:hypothetical protein
MRKTDRAFFHAPKGCIVVGHKTSANERFYTGRRQCSSILPSLIPILHPLSPLL